MRSSVSHRVDFPEALFESSVLMLQFQRLLHRVILPFVLLVLSTGCSRTARDLHLDQPKAREACKTFLSAWKEGKKTADLKPKVIGRDFAWDAGQKLVAFEFLPDETNDGTNLHIPVRLTLQKEDGPESQSDAIYVVGTSPVVTVFRE
jgi:hypothetical protein